MRVLNRFGVYLNGTPPLSRLSEWMILSGFPIRRARVLFAALVRAVAAPRPQFRIRDETAFHRIHVHVVQLLDHLLPAPHIEVVKPRLPETSWRAARRLLPQTQLAGTARPSGLPAQQS